MERKRESESCSWPDCDHRSGPQFVTLRFLVGVIANEYYVPKATIWPAEKAEVK
jgi:hypothetical protein